MGRKLMRVQLDFEWEIGQIWKGYVNPYRSLSCKACDGKGDSPELLRLSKEWYGLSPFSPVAYGSVLYTEDHPSIQALAKRNTEYDGTNNYRFMNECRRLRDRFNSSWCHHLIQADVDALIKDERLWNFTRVPRTEEQLEIVRQKVAASGNSWLPKSNGYCPTAQEVNDWSLLGLGHDGINQWTCVRARAKREGILEESCRFCKGKGEFWFSEEIERLHDVWVDEEPPTGPGFQLWETTSEGSPVSPVFSSLEDLCVWCESNATTFGSAKTTKEEWKKMLGEDFVHHTERNMTFL